MVGCPFAAAVVLPARFILTDGMLLILLSGLSLTGVGGLVALRSWCSVLSFGLLLGCLLSIRVGCPSRLRFRGSGRFMMSVYSSCPGTMLCNLMSVWILMMSLVPGLSGLVLLRLHLLMLFGLVEVLSPVLGRRSALFRIVRLGGHKVKKARCNAADAVDAADVFMYRDSSSIAPLLDMRRRFKAVMDVLGAMVQYGVSLARSVELAAQWVRILAARHWYPVVTLMISMRGL